MTTIDRSPEQLDAEAAIKPDLGDRIAVHRAMYRHDNGLPLKLHQFTGDDEGIGAAFNSLFAAYLDGTAGHTDSWNGALLWMRERVCRGRHSTHWAAEWGGSLCYKLVSYVIRQEWGIPEAMGRLGLTDEELTAKTLESALVAIERRLEWMLYGEAPEVKREVAEWMSAPHRHHVTPGLHLEECEQCRRAA